MSTGAGTSPFQHAVEPVPRPSRARRLTPGRGWGAGRAAGRRIAAGPPSGGEALPAEPARLFPPLHPAFVTFKGGSGGSQRRRHRSPPGASCGDMPVSHGRPAGDGAGNGAGVAAGDGAGVVAGQDRGARDGARDSERDGAHDGAAPPCAHRAPPAAGRRALTWAKRQRRVTSRGIDQEGG